MNKLLKKTIFMGLILGLVSCKKKEDVPVPTATKVKNEIHLNSADVKKNQMAQLRKIIAKKGFKYNEFITLRDKTGEYYRNYQISSDSKKDFDRVLNEYQNSILKIVTQEHYLSNHTNATFTPVLYSPSAINSNSWIGKVNTTENALHIAFLESNIPKGKVVSRIPNWGNRKNELISILWPITVRYFYGYALAFTVTNYGRPPFYTLFAASMVQDWSSRAFNDYYLFPSCSYYVFQRPNPDFNYAAPWLLRIVNSDEATIFGVDIMVL